jgi:hypothetical protein
MIYWRKSTLARLSGLTVLLVLAGFWLQPANRPVAAQAQPVLNNQAEVDFPNTVTFRLELAPELTVAEAWLTYQTGRNSCLQAGTQVPVEVDGSLLEWTWVLSRSGNPPPGAALSWHWTVTDTSGQTFTTPQQQLTFVDDRFDWQTITAADVGESLQLRLHWYRGQEVGPLLMEAAVAGLKRLQADMGITLQDEVQFFIYGAAADMRQAVLYIQDWAGGVAFSEYGVILIGVSPGQAESWGQATVRHELAHLVVDQFGRSCLGGGRPTWLNEGLAVYAEGEPDEATLADIARGIRDNSFAPVRSLNGSFPTHDEAAGMAYSQSFSLVDYLLSTYGPEKMQQLLLTLAAAEGYDQALEQVYGFNADGLEVAWRAAIGASPRSIPATPTPILAANVPTVVPLNAIQPVATPPEAAVVPTVAPASQNDRTGGCVLGLAPLAALVLLVGRRPRRRS